LKKILWITRMAPADIDSAGLILQYRTLEILSKKHKITVLSMKEDYGTNPLKSIGVNAVKFQNDDHLRRLLRGKFDICVLCWWDLASQFIPKIRDCVDKIIVNTIDVEYVRNLREYELDKKIDLSAIRRKKERELQTYKQADEVWFVTKNDVPEEYKSDIVIAGVMYPNREKLVKALKPISKDVKIRTINCKHWEEKLRDCKPWIKYYHPDTVPVQELVKYYNGAKIILVGNRDFDPNNDHRQHGISSLAIGRIFQETACKRLVMSDATRPNLKEHFEYGKEIVVFHDEDDLREKIIHYLRNDNEREKIAQSGYERTMKENTYYHRLKTINDYVNTNYERLRKTDK